MTDLEGLVQPELPATGPSEAPPDSADGDGLIGVPLEIVRQAQKMETIGLLAAGVAHELNNTLASIAAFSQLLRTDPELPQNLRSQADMLVQEANRTRAIIQNLLDFARARPAERVPTELRPLIESVLGLQSDAFGNGRAEVVVDIPPDMPPIPMDRTQMQQVLVNLTVNAAQAIRESGRPGTLRIAAATATNVDENPIVRIEVSDDGPGVPPALKERLFRPFVTTKPPDPGTGLGLSVSLGIVAGHGGILQHRAGPGGVGATFVIELPLGEPVERAPATAPALAPTTSSATDGAAHRTRRVLVLDDESAIREFLGRALRRAGYEPVLATNGATALELIRSEPPDAILCDHRMAGMSGTAFHDAVAAIAPQLGRRFAFMSGDILNPELREFAKTRGILLLGKPFDLASVGRTVASLLETERAT